VKISADEARRIARLAHLEFSEAEHEELARQLSDILEYVERIGAIDTAAVSPTSHVQESGEAFREDVERPSLPEPEALSNAPESDGGHFKVPRVIG
jgi:aspartyl-tRNA(Asn)/glutamyl-tRNA(Gln) amidotransferase subunit C